MIFGGFAISFAILKGGATPYAGVAIKLFTIMLGDFQQSDVLDMLQVDVASVDHRNLWCVRGRGGAGGWGGTGHLGGIWVWPGGHGMEPGGGGWDGGRGRSGTQARAARVCGQAPSHSVTCTEGPLLAGPLAACRHPHTYPPCGRFRPGGLAACTPMCDTHWHTRAWTSWP